MKKYFYFSSLFICAFLFNSGVAHADLSLTSGNNATTTPNVATAITGFQIVGASTDTTPVKLFATNGSLSMSVTTGLTFSGSQTGSTIYFSGTVANINAALSTLKYTRSSIGTDTLEVSLVNPGEVFFTTNNHLYKFVSGSYSWSTAKTAAEAQTAYGATGYLATITSSAENSFVSGRLTGDGWIGASDSETEGTWKWMTGPETGTTFWQGTSGGSVVGGNYRNWAAGEPNQAGEEDCAETYVSTGTWNDFPCGALLGYVVEFGTPGTLPTVVAKNISVVTADVPAVTSLSPANASTTVSTSSNFVISFSKTVSKGTGNILIKKTFDNSIVETIDVTSSVVTGGGTNTITINPDTTLNEGTSYYIVIPNTAFKDSSNNFFDGIAASTTWSFTTTDVTAPVISNIATSSIASTAGTIQWNTNEQASTKVIYSIDNNFGSTTSETDKISRVTSHSQSLSNLLACTTYNFKVVSGDAFNNYSTSTSSLFTTLGCPVNVAPLTATTTSVTVASPATSTLTESGRTLNIATPANFTATSSTVVIQIKSIDSNPVIDTLGAPANLSNAAQIAFDVTALVNSSVVLNSFNTPVTISYTYTDQDIVGLNESSLSMYHYHNSTWEKLSDCTVYPDSNTITCSTPSFSIFAIFGDPASTTPTNQTVLSSGGGSGTTIPARVNNLIAMGNTSAAEQLKKEWPAQFSQSVSTSTTSVGSIASSSFKRNLQRGMSGEDVRALQKFLNNHGFIISQSGEGSINNETTYFGTATKNSLIQYQIKNNISPSTGYFGPKTRAYINTTN